ncbi:MAG: winged helix-turn-helix domain-containing protein [Limnochordia bacterium]|jgi:molybdate transport system regulatory protein
MHCKVWLTQDGKALMGSGRAKLLMRIEEYESISKAAESLNMSYRAAWGKIREAEERLGFPLIETQVGGVSGGGTRLTEEGHRFLNRYLEFQRRVDAEARRLFAEIFAGAP